MKKVVGILGVILVVMALFFNTNNLNSTIVKDLNLATLLSINSANAEDGDCDQCVVSVPILGVRFSCKTVQGETCKKTSGETSVECNNAKQC